MKTNFDPSIGIKLGIDTKIYDTPPINPNFMKYKKRITKVIKKRNTLNYFFDRKLLTQAREHLNTHNKKISTKNIIALVHPFYLFLTNMKELNENTQKDAKQYLNNLLKIINNKDKTNYKILIFDTLQDYASTTSTLLEQKKIDAVILTHQDSGTMLKKKDILNHNTKNMYIGGGYLGRCLSSTIEQLIISQPNLTAIRDLCLFPPETNYSSILATPNKLKPNKEYNVESLKEIAHKLNIDLN